MNLKPFFSILLAGASLTAVAQSHLEGVEYYNADQLENARELLTRNYNNAATDKAIANYYLGQIALDNKNIKEAATYFQKGIDANPDYGFNYAGLGAVALRNGNAKEAESFFKEGESKAKKDASYNIAVARAYYDVDPALYSSEIEKRVAKARKTNLKDPSIYLFEGDMKKDHDDVGGAAALYEMAATYNPTSAEAYVKYANLFNRVNPGFAITKLKELLSQNPKSALGQKELANAYYNNNDFANAAAEYGKYVNNPNHFKQDEDRYSFLLFYGQDYQKGNDYATALLAETPGNFTAQRFQYMNAAQIPAMKVKLPQMAAALYKNHKADPQNNKLAAIDYTLIAEEYSGADDYNTAIEVLNEAIKVMPENANFDKQLAMTYVDLTQLTNAAKAYRGYINKTAEPSFNDYNQQATFCYYAGVENKKDNPAVAEEFFKEAEQNINKALEMAPESYKGRKILGDIAMQRATDEKGVRTAAKPFYEEAIVYLEKSDDPSRYASDAKTMYNYLGNYYLDQKDVAKAKENFNKYLIYDPNNADYRKFVENLK